MNTNRTRRPTVVVPADALTHRPIWAADTRAHQNDTLAMVTHSSGRTIFEADAETGEAEDCREDALTVRAERSESAVIRPDGSLADLQTTASVIVAGWQFTATMAREIAQAILDAADEAESR